METFIVKGTEPNRVFQTLPTSRASTHILFGRYIGPNIARVVFPLNQLSRITYPDTLSVWQMRLNDDMKFKMRILQLSLERCEKHFEKVSHQTDQT